MIYIVFKAAILDMRRKGNVMFYKNKISVIVPVFNAEDTLERCVNSILKQSYNGIEIILVNDGSDDFSDEICQNYCQEYPDRIKYISISHSGQGMARNTGISAATGEYIGFVDADDEIHVNMYKEMIACAKQNTAEIVICNVRLIDFDGKTSTIQQSLNYGEYNLKNYIQYGINLCSPCNKIYRKELFRKFRFNDITFEDAELIPVMVSYAKNVQFIKKHFYTYRLRSDSTSQSKENFRIKDFLESIKNSVKNVNPEYREELAYWHARSIMNGLTGNRREYLSQMKSFVDENKNLFEDNKLIQKDCYVKTIYNLSNFETELESDYPYNLTIVTSLSKEYWDELLKRQSIDCSFVQIIYINDEYKPDFSDIKGKYVTRIDEDPEFHEDFLEKLIFILKIYYGNATMVGIPGSAEKKGVQNLNIAANYKKIDLNKYTIFYNTKKLVDQWIAGHGFHTVEFLYYALLKDPHLLVINQLAGCMRVIPTVISYNNLQDNYVLFRLISTALKDAMAVKLGVPAYYQFIAMSHIKQIITVEYEEEEDELLYEVSRETVKEALGLIQDGIMASVPRTTPEHKVYFFKLKYGKEAELVPKDGKLQLVYNGRSIYCQDDTYTLFEFIDYENGVLSLEGRTIALNCTEDEEIVFYATSGGMIYPAHFLRRDCSRFCLGEQIFRGMEFKIDIPIQKEVGEYIFSFFYIYRGYKCARNDIRFAKYAPLTKKFKASYWKHHDRALTYERKYLHFRLCGKKGKYLLEKSFLEEIKKSLPENEYNEIKKLRTRYHIFQAFSKKRIWLISDKAHRGDDNGEAFFKFLNSDPVAKRNIDSYFVMDPDSPTYDEIKSIGKITHFNSFHHKLLSLICEYQFGAYVHVSIVAPLANQRDYFKDILKKPKVVFLQHGITQNNLSSALHKYNQNFKAIITTTEQETESFKEFDYFYKDDQIKLLGFPRYDFLHDDNKNYITFAPTWRRYLFGDFDQPSESYLLNDDFHESDYYKFYTGVVNSDRLQNALDKYGYQIHFIPHPVFFPYVKEFTFNSNVVMHGAEVSYNQMFAKSSLFITDYSSAVFDCAYMKKPIFYVQFDQEEFYASQYDKGMFDYEKQGFGEVVGTVEDTIDLIIEYMKNGCRMKEKYQNRVDEFFAFHDTNNCKRIFTEFLN